MLQDGTLPKNGQTGVKVQICIRVDYCRLTCKVEAVDGALFLDRSLLFWMVAGLNNVNAPPLFHILTQSITKI